MSNNEERQRRANDSVHEHDGAASHTCGCGKITWYVTEDGEHVARRPTCNECARRLEKKGEI